MLKLPGGRNREVIKKVGLERGGMCHPVEPGHSRCSFWLFFSQPKLCNRLREPVHPNRPQPFKPAKSHIQEEEVSGTGHAGGPAGSKVGVCLTDELLRG